jgi:hypothetical protein
VTDQTEGGRCINNQRVLRNVQDKKGKQPTLNDQERFVRWMDLEKEEGCAHHEADELILYFRGMGLTVTGDPGKRGLGTS